MKQPDMEIYQYQDGTLKMQSHYSAWYNPEYWVSCHGKIICKFKIYKK